MELSQEKVDQIRAYYRKTMSAKEMHAFEETLARDAHFAAQAKAYYQLFLAIDNAGQEELIQKLKAQYKSKNKSPALKFSMLQKAAAIILLVAMLPIGYFYFQSKSTSQDLYLEYYKPATLETLRNEKNDSENQFWELAVKEYSAGNYQNAVITWQKYLDQAGPIKQADATLFLGICQLEIDKPNLALQNFIILANGVSARKADGIWYAALTELKLGNKEKAAQYLETLVNLKLPYYTKMAQPLLAKI